MIAQGPFCACTGRLRGSGEAAVTSYWLEGGAAARPAMPLGTHSLADAAARAAPAVVNVTVQGASGAPHNVSGLFWRHACMAQPLCEGSKPTLLHASRADLAHYLLSLTPALAVHGAVLGAPARSQKLLWPTRPCLCPYLCDLVLHGAGRFCE